MLSPTDVDQLIDVDGLTIVIDPISEPLLAGTTVDLKVEGVNRTLRFDNPNVVSECGCGESFAVGASVLIAAGMTRTKFLKEKPSWQSNVPYLSLSLMLSGKTSLVKSKAVSSSWSYNRCDENAAT